MTTYLPSITLPRFIFTNPALSILLPVTSGLIVGALTQPNSRRGSLRLKQPPLQPPPWAFGPVWTTLYALMGYGAHRAWVTGVASLDPQVVALTKQGATLYTIQLGLNLIWMPLFFGFLRPIEATVDIVALTGAVGYLSYIWSQVDNVASRTLYPYLGWLGLATYLSAGSGYLNDWYFKDKFEENPDGQSSERMRKQE